LFSGVHCRISREDSDPVAFFAEDDGGGPVREASSPDSGPSSSIVEELTKPVPPPDP
jgi:hypothetical protein